MNLGLPGKLAIVSGSTAGIGYAIAAALADERARVIVNGRTKERVDSAVERLRLNNRGAEFSGVVADLGTAAGVAVLTKEVPSADILVNNLGIFEVKPFLEIPDEDWVRFFEVNVLSGVRLSRHYLPGMLKKNWGRIIFISSESGQDIPTEMVHYGMTKTAQIAVARGIAQAVATTGVTANSVLVGPTSSEGANNFMQSLALQQAKSPAEIEKDFFASSRPTSLLKRWETPEEVASVVAFLAGHQSAIINGAAVRAEGGVIQSIL